MKTRVRLTLRLAAAALTVAAFAGGSANLSAVDCHQSHKCQDTWFGADYCYVDVSTTGWACYMSGEECISDPQSCPPTVES